MSDAQLSSTKPYLIRAFYDWITDNECTPYIIVNANEPNTEVPKEYVQDGRIILNIAMQAVHNLQMTNEFIDFDARFKGISRSIYIPITAIIAIYAHENGRGMVFAEEATGETADQQTPPPATKPTLVATDNKVAPITSPSGKSKPRGKPTLKIVK